MLRFSRAATAAVFALSASAASAVTYTFVGSWTPDDPRGPTWDASPPNGPLAYTGQEAAAFLFGGTASDYVISTVDANPGHIDFQAVYDVIGYGAITASQSFNQKYLGLYYGPTSGYTGDPSVDAASALVQDNGIAGTNYAFTVTAGVPEPASWTLLITGFGLAGAALRRRSTVRTA